MKKIVITSLVVAMVVGLGLAFADKPLGDNGYNGNGCPSGPHFNLNIIGVKDKDAEMSGNGHVIFVPLGSAGVTKSTKIYLIEGEDFAVLDKNGTDGRAEFQLPNPDPDNDGVTEYSVFARPLGKPNGKAKMTTGAWDPDIGEYVYSVCVLELERTKGKQRFENVSKELLYIYAYIWVNAGLDPSDPSDDVYEFMRVPLFDDALEDYFWKYDNNGLKIVQLRFYEGLATIVPDIVTILPTSGPQGANDYPIVISGTGIGLGTTDPTVDIDCNRIGDIQVIVLDNDTLGVTLDIASNAPLGVYEVLVTRDDGTEFIGGFEVVAP